MKRIGLTQRVEVAPGYGERRDCLDQRWAGLLLSLGYCPVPLANDVSDVALYVATLGLDGVILTGGNDLCEVQGGANVAPERDRFEHSLLDVFSARDLPVLGVCRGLQLMNVHYGGDLKAIEGHISHPHRVTLDPGFFSGHSEPILVNSYHQFAIGESGRSGQLKPLAWAEDGTIEAAVHESLPQFGIMWHPEREEALAEHDLLVVRTTLGQEPA